MKNRILKILYVFLLFFFCNFSNLFSASVAITDPDFSETYEACVKVSFDCTFDSGGDTTIADLDYSWNIDGNSYSEKSPEHTFSSIGNKTITLSVSYSYQYQSTGCWNDVAKDYSAPCRTSTSISAPSKTISIVDTTAPAWQDDDDSDDQIIYLSSGAKKIDGNWYANCSSISFDADAQDCIGVSKYVMQNGTGRDSSGLPTWPSTWMDIYIMSTTWALNNHAVDEYKDIRVKAVDAIPNTSSAQSISLMLDTQPPNNDGAITILNAYNANGNIYVKSPVKFYWAEFSDPPKSTGAPTSGAYNYSYGKYTLSGQSETYLKIDEPTSGAPVQVEYTDCVEQVVELFVQARDRAGNLSPYPGKLKTVYLDNKGPHLTSIVVDGSTFLSDQSVEFGNPILINGATVSVLDVNLIDWNDIGSGVNISSSYKLDVYEKYGSQQLKFSGQNQSDDSMFNVNINSWNQGFYRVVASRQDNVGNWGFNFNGCQATGIDLFVNLPPLPLSGLSGLDVGVGGAVYLTWPPLPDNHQDVIDFSHYEIKVIKFNLDGSPTGEEVIVSTQPNIPNGHQIGEFFAYGEYGFKYRFQIQVVDDSGFVSDWSTPTTFITPSINPPEIISIQDTGASHNLKINWQWKDKLPSNVVRPADLYDGLDGFEIQRDETGDFSSGSFISLNDTSLIQIGNGVISGEYRVYYLYDNDQTLINGNSYFYRVGLKKTGTYGYSGSLSGIPSFAPVLNTPAHPIDLFDPEIGSILEVKWYWDDLIADGFSDDVNIDKFIIYSSSDANFDEDSGEYKDEIYNFPVTPGSYPLDYLFHDWNASMGVEKYYGIVVVDDVGNKSPIAISSYKMKASLKAPDSLTVEEVWEPGALKISWDWNVPDGYLISQTHLAGFYIYRGTIPDFQPTAGSRIYTIPSNLLETYELYDIDLPVNNEKYYYKIAAYDDSIPAIPSDIIPTGIAVQGDPLISSLESLNFYIYNTDEANGNALRISFEQVLDVDQIGYRIEESTSPNFLKSEVDDLNWFYMEASSDPPSGETMIKDSSGLDEGRTYYYRVAAIEKIDTGSRLGFYSDVKTGTPYNFKKPDPPQFLTANSGDGVVNLEWNIGEEWDIRGYRIYRSSISETEMVLLDTIESKETHIYIDTTVQNGVTYFYQVAAFDRIWEGMPGPVVYATPGNQIPPAKPVGLWANGDNEKVELSWTANKDIDIQGYNIYRTTFGPNSHAYTADDLINASIVLNNPDKDGKMTWTDTTVQNDIVYYYRIAAIDQPIPTQLESELSQEVFAQPGAGYFYIYDVNGDLNSDAYIDPTGYDSNIHDKYLTVKYFVRRDVQWIRLVVSKVNIDGSLSDIYEQKVMNPHYSHSLEGKITDFFPEFLWTGKYNMPSYPDDRYVPANKYSFYLQGSINPTLDERWNHFLYVMGVNKIDVEITDMNNNPIAIAKWNQRIRVKARVQDFSGNPIPYENLNYSFNINDQNTKCHRVNSMGEFVYETDLYNWGLEKITVQLCDESVDVDVESELRIQTPEIILIPEYNNVDVGEFYNVTISVLNMNLSQKIKWYRKFGESGQYVKLINPDDGSDLWLQGQDLPQQQEQLGVYYYYATADNGKCTVTSDEVAVLVGTPSLNIIVRDNNLDKPNNIIPQNGTAYILPEPRMPDLQFSIDPTLVQYIQTSQLKVSWTAENNTGNPSNPRADTFSQIFNISFNAEGLGILDKSLQDNFCGGNAELYINNVLINEFEIRAQNAISPDYLGAPSIDEIKAYCDELKYQVLIFKESGWTWLPFSTSEQNLGYPRLGLDKNKDNSIGIGLGQITIPYHDVTSHMAWNWKANVDYAKTFFDDRMQRALSIPIKFRANGINVTDFTEKELYIATYACYNSGSDSGMEWEWNNPNDEALGGSWVLKDVVPNVYEVPAYGSSCQSWLENGGAPYSQWTVR